MSRFPSSKGHKYVSEMAVTANNFKALLKKEIFFNFYKKLKQKKKPRK